eukprot:jgi/Tetstr1/436839/TSEL_025616.t1
MASTSPPETAGTLPSSGKKRSADHMRNAEQSCQPGTDDIDVHTELAQAGSGASKDRAECRVPGCTSTVADETLRNSHRVKLCVVHQKADSVDVAGVEHRFCQQCTRLHPLDLFDGDKRGCRKRLERHNRRRQRKVKMSKLRGSNDESHSTSIAMSHPPNNGFYGMMGNQWMMNQRVSDETENHNMPQMSITLFERQRLAHQWLNLNPVFI